MINIGGPSHTGVPSNTSQKASLCLEGRDAPSDSTWPGENLLKTLVEIRLQLCL